MPQVQHQLLGALLFQILNLRSDVLRVATFQALHLNQSDLIVHQLRGHGRVLHHGARQSEFLRLGLLESQHAYFHRTARIALQQQFGESQRHISSGDAVDGLQNVRGGQSSLGGGRAGNGVYDADVAELLRQDQADAGLMLAFARGPLLVLIGVQVAGVRIDGFE